MADVCAAQVEINDYPQHARWKATHKESLSAIVEFCDVCITAKVRCAALHQTPVKRRGLALLGRPGPALLCPALPCPASHLQHRESLRWQA